jgi:TolB-like protein/DNA-binding SARP family transcriptional activator
MARIDITLFGYPAVSIEGKNAHFSRAKTLGLLSYIVINRSLHSREYLSALFWPEMDNGHARANLRLALAELCKIIGKECMQISRENIKYTGTTDIFVDVEQFSTLIADYKKRKDPTKLKEAVLLYQDGLLNGFHCSASREFEEWQYFETEAARSSYAISLQELIISSNTENEYRQSVEYAGRLSRIDPLNEEYQRVYMDSLSKAGQFKQAFNQFKKLERRLEEEEEEGPEQETVDLFEKIRGSKNTEQSFLHIVSSRGRRNGSRRWLYFVYGGCGMLGILFFLLFFDVPDESKHSIAVLPLEAVCTEENADGFAAAFTHALISDLSRYDSFEVVSYSTMAKYKYTGKMIPEIAEELGVDYIVNGICIKDGNQVRVSAQLIETRSDTCIWADVYDRRYKEGFELEREVGNDIIRKIRQQLSPGELTGTEEVGITVPNIEKY